MPELPINSWHRKLVRFVAYDGMEKFFPADKIIMTGNPVRQNLTKDMPSKEEALRSFHLQPGKRQS